MVIENLVLVSFQKYCAIFINDNFCNIEFPTSIGFLMSLHQPQIQSIQFKCTFKLHHPFAFPLSKAREEPYVFGINSRTIRGFVK
jgi:hypothetical protein